MAQSVNRSLLDHSYMTGDSVKGEKDRKSDVSALPDRNSNGGAGDGPKAHVFLKTEDDYDTSRQSGLIQLEDGSLIMAEPGCDVVKLEDGSFVGVKKEDCLDLEQEGSCVKFNDGFLVRMNGEIVFVGNGQELVMTEEAGDESADEGDSKEVMHWEVKSEPDEEDEEALKEEEEEEDAEGLKEDDADFEVDGSDENGEDSERNPDTLTQRYVMVMLDSNGVPVVGDPNNSASLENGTESATASNVTCDDDDEVSETEKEVNDRLRGSRLNNKKSCLCESCGLEFSNPEALKSHVAAQHSTTAGLYRCGVCGKEFAMLYFATEHVRRHAVAQLRRVYRCDVCDASFNYSSNLSRHRQVHSSEKTHVCEVCGKAFHQKSNLRSHAEMHNPPERRRQTNLGTSSSSSDGGNKRRPKRFACDTCGKRFTNVAGLKNHGALHSNYRPHECPICHKGFTLTSCLRTHVATVHTEGSHVCETCGKAYRSAHYLTIHTRIHRGIKEFGCDVCQKAFIDQPSLKLHMRTHTGEKPYACSVCGRTFSQQAHVKTHLRLHTGEKPYDCPVCGKKFRQLSNVLEHGQTHKKKLL